MKKETKKKLERELVNAVDSVLAKHNAKAIAKTKKAVKESAKSVVKKFSKAVKALEKQKALIKSKRKPARKVSVKKTVTVSTGARRGRPRRITKLTDSAVVTSPVISPEGSDSGNS